MALQVDRAHKKVHNEDPNHPSRKELDFMAPYFFGTEDRANFLLVTTLIGNITTHNMEYYNIMHTLSFPISFIFFVTGA